MYKSILLLDVKLNHVKISGTCTPLDGVGLQERCIKFILNCDLNALKTPLHNENFLLPDISTPKINGSS